MLAAAAALLVVVVVGVLLLTREPKVAPLVTVHVRSEPPGAQVLLDGQDTGVVTDGDVTLPAARSGTVTLTLRKPEYREATRVLRLPLGASDLRFVMEALPPVVTSTIALPVITEPPGAAVTVDGQAVKGTTPLTVSVDPAREHRIAVRLEGHAPQEVSVAAGAAAPVRFTLDALGPQGRVAVSAAYPLDVIWRGKVLSHGQPSPEVGVPAGRQVLTLVATTYFLRQNVTVDVPRPPAVAAVAAPALGKINIRANPDNCQVFIDGEFVEYPPILDRAIAAGEHRVAFKWPDGARHEESVQVSRGGPAYVMGRKD
jgi:hypothetical protein